MSVTKNERAPAHGEAYVHISGQSNKPLSAPPHALPGDVFLSELQANLNDGLSSTEAAERLTGYGLNELDDGPGVQPLKILLRQAANAMILVNYTMSPSDPHIF